MSPRAKLTSGFFAIAAVLAVLIPVGISGDIEPAVGTSDAEAAQVEPITGTLSKPGYTVIALAANGEAASDIAGPGGSFSLVPPAETSTLHLRAPHGTYAGPIVLEPAKNFELEAAQEDAKQAKKKVKRAEKKVKRAKSKVNKAQKKLKRASGKQAKQKASRRLKKAKKQLKKAKQKLKQAKKKLKKARAQLEQAKAEDADRPNHAILGLRAGAALGAVTVNSAAGFANAGGLTEQQWNASVDTAYEAQAKAGVPIGTGNFGRVRSSQLTGSGIGDLDRDGVSDPLDIDDDGDLVLDNLDSAPSGSNARTTSLSPSGDFPLSQRLQLGTIPVNANAPGIGEARIEAALPSTGHIAMRMQALADGSIELDCGQPQGSASPGLIYCTKGGTGTLADPHLGAEQGDPFPDCCDEDDDGFGTVGSLNRNTFSFFHGATSDQIKSGDVLIQRIEHTDGSEEELVATVQYVFVTTPAVASYDDGQGNSKTFDYSVPPDFTHLPVKAGPNGDVVVELTFWRPQRRPIPPETDEWIDMGGLDYFVAALPERGAQFCAQDSYSSSDPNLVPQEIVGDWPPGGGYWDQADDRPASPDDTAAFEVNLTECFERTGFAIEESGGWIELGATAHKGSQYDSGDSGDLTSMRLQFDVVP